MKQRSTPTDLQREVDRLRRQSRRLMAAEGAIQRQNEHLRVLHETAVGLLDRLDRRELLQSILERAADLADTGHGYIYLYDPIENLMEIKVGMGLFDRQIGLRVKIGQGFGGHVWRSGRTVMVPDYQSWAGKLQDPSLESLRCVVGIPLKQEDTVRGVIGLAHVIPEAQFSPEDIRILERFAAFALLAIEKAELYAELRKELDERQKAEARFRENESRYRTFLDSSPDPIVVYDMQGEAGYVNPAFEQTFGISREEVLGRRIDFVPEQAWPETRSAIESMLKGQKIRLFETQRLTKEGHILDVQISSCLYKDENGQPVGNIVTLRDITALKKAERALRSYQDQLEELVQERTSELASEVEVRRRAEIQLRKREKELQAQSQHLEEVNTALRVLLKQRGEDKVELQESVSGNIRNLVAPYLQQLKHTKLSTRQDTLVRILESNLDNIVSPFINRLSQKFARFTPAEIRVANLIKEGKTNKEIAELMLISKNTVLYHRHNIRKKLKLTNTPANLRAYLLTFDE